MDSFQLAAARWTLTHDVSPGFRGELLAALTALDVPGVDDEL
jgi:hypothetical protein